LERNGKLSRPGTPAPSSVAGRVATVLLFASTPKRAIRLKPTRAPGVALAPSLGPGLPPENRWAAVCRSGRGGAIVALLGVCYAGAGGVLAGKGVREE